MNIRLPDHSAYYQAVGEEDERLQAQLDEIRAAQDVGELTVRQAADRRIDALEAHLESLRRLRADHLGDQA